MSKTTLFLIFFLIFNILSCEINNSDDEQEINTESPGIDEIIIGDGTRYDITDESSFDAVPWLDLESGDTVLIHYKKEPYRRKIGLKGVGTTSQPIRICGIPDSSGRLPEISGENSITGPGFDDSFFNPDFPEWGEALGVIVINDQWGNKPENIVIQNLKITGAYYAHSFTDKAGVTQNYIRNASGIYIVVGKNISVRGCEITDNGNGIFTNSNVNSIERTTEEVLIEYNYLYDNGNEKNEALGIPGYGRHNLYIQSKGMIVQYNRIGRLRPGAMGSSLKDRSAGSIIRYNWIESAARTLDLVEQEDASPVQDDPRYGFDYVYGNILINSKNDGTGLASAGNIIHYGGDNSVNNDGEDSNGTCRNGTLEFFNNTVVIINYDDRSGDWNRDYIFQLSTHNDTVNIRNNIFYAYFPNAEIYMALMNRFGTANLEGVNWFVTNWKEGHIEDDYKPFVGTINRNGTILTGTDPGFQNLLDYDFSLTAASACIDAGSLLPSSITNNYPLDSMYQVHYSGISRDINGSEIDLGSFER